MPSLFPSSSPGPPLPTYRSLLVTGPYHASAPIHLVLSHALEHPGSHPMIISPSRTSLQQELRNLNDSWITNNSRQGAVIDLTTRISVFYPPSPLHLCLFLSMLRTYTAEDAANSGPWMNPMTTRAYPPDLIVLHEPSLYLISSSSMDSSSHTVSSYLTLVTRVFSAISTISTQSSGSVSPSFVLFDSQLYKLKLPVVRHPPRHTNEEEDQQNDRLEAVLVFVEKYFEWTAYFEQGDDLDVIPSSQGDDSMEDSLTTSRRLKLIRLEDEERAEWVAWKEFMRPAQVPASDLRERHFVFDGR